MTDSNQMDLVQDSDNLEINEDADLHEHPDNVHDEDGSEVNHSEESLPENGGEPTLEEDKSGDDREIDLKELPKDIQTQVGRVIAAQRQKLKQKAYEEAMQQVQYELATQQRTQQQPQSNHQPQSNEVWDDVTQQYVDINSPLGQVAWREQIAKERQRNAELQHQQELARARDDDLLDKVNKGYQKYNDFDKNLETLRGQGTNYMGYALYEAENPAAVIQYLGRNPAEIERIKKMSPARQTAAMLSIDDKLKNPRQVTKASAPSKPINGGASKNSSAETQSYQQRVEYYKQKYSTPRTW